MVKEIVIFRSVIIHLFRIGNGLATLINFNYICFAISVTAAKSIY